MKNVGKILKLLSLILLAVGGVFFYNAQEKKQEGITIAFYNVENLLDTIDDKHTEDNDFLPTSKLKWDTKRYQQKLENLSKVIEVLGDENGPEILGLCEVENDNVIYDLIHMPLIQKRDYHFIHKDSKDKRGIDVALLYKEGFFKPFVTKCYDIHYNENENTSSTRSILLVGGLVRKDTIFLMVNHWPSRRAGKEESEHKRMAASNKLREVYDSLISVKPNANVIMMGDFNDEPTDKSIKHIVDRGNEKGKNIVFNPFEELKKDGEGSIKFKSKWELFDQILLSNSLIKSTHHSYINKSATVFHPEWMHYKDDFDKGPFKTYSGSKYYGGYSDHFPVYIQLK